MKRSFRVCGVLFSCCAVALTGCKKKQSEVVAPVAYDLNINLKQLVETLSTNSDPSVLDSLSKVRNGLRYGYDYDSVLTALDSLSQNPNVTEPQKKVVAEVTDQVKKELNQVKATQ